MGTRADFYIGLGPAMTWLGSIAGDGGLEARTARLRFACTLTEYLAAVRELSADDDFVSPDGGWPWPWETSKVTDYAYAFQADSVFVSRAGAPWVSVQVPSFPVMRLAGRLRGKIIAAEVAAAVANLDVRKLI